MIASQSTCKQVGLLKWYHFSSWGPLTWLLLKQFRLFFVANSHTLSWNWPRPYSFPSVLFRWTMRACSCCRNITLMPVTSATGEHLPQNPLRWRTVSTRDLYVILSDERNKERLIGGSITLHKHGVPSVTGRTVLQDNPRQTSYWVTVSYEGMCLPSAAKRGVF